MHSHRHLFGSGLIASLLLFSFASAAPSSAEAWLNNYYQQPAPERLAPAVVELSRSGFFEQPGNVSLAIGFLGAVIAEHPDRARELLAANRVLPVAHQRIVASALWYSGYPDGAAQLRALARSSDPALRRDIEALLAQTPDLRDAEVRSARSLELQWGVFLATGETEPVRQILAALGSTDDAELSQNVRWSLAQNAVQHDRVLAICREELSRQPNAVRETLRAVINDSERVRQPST